MGIKQKRPVNLDLTTITLPITALASILHRISGLFLFICIPMLLWMLDASLRSAESFARLQECLSSFGAKLTLWLFLSAVVYHTLAGIKHLFADVGFGETLPAARLLSKLVLGASVIIAIALGVWLWS